MTVKAHIAASGSDIGQAVIGAEAMSITARELEEVVKDLRKALDRLLESTFRRTDRETLQEDYGRLGVGAYEDAEAALRMADGKLGAKLWRTGSAAGA